MNANEMAVEKNDFRQIDYIKNYCCYNDCMKMTKGNSEIVQIDSTKCNCKTISVNKDNVTKN